MVTRPSRDRTQKSKAKASNEEHSRMQRSMRIIQAIWEQEQLRGRANRINFQVLRSLQWHPANGKGDDGAHSQETAGCIKRNREKASRKDKVTRQAGDQYNDLEEPRSLHRLQGTQKRL